MSDGASSGEGGRSNYTMIAIVLAGLAVWAALGFPGWPSAGASLPPPVDLAYSGGSGGLKSLFTDIAREITSNNGDRARAMMASLVPQQSTASKPTDPNADPKAATAKTDFTEVFRINPTASQVSRYERSAKTVLNTFYRDLRVLGTVKNPEYEVTVESASTERSKGSVSPQLAKMIDGTVYSLYEVHVQIDQGNGSASHPRLSGVCVYVNGQWRLMTTDIADMLPD